MVISHGRLSGTNLWLGSGYTRSMNFWRLLVRASFHGILALWRLRFSCGRNLFLMRCYARSTNSHRHVVWWTFAWLFELYGQDFPFLGYCNVCVSWFLVSMERRIFYAPWHGSVIFSGGRFLDLTFGFARGTNHRVYFVCKVFGISRMDILFSRLLQRLCVTIFLRIIVMALHWRRVPCPGGWEFPGQLLIKKLL